MQSTLERGKMRLADIPARYRGRRWSGWRGLVGAALVSIPLAIGSGPASAGVSAQDGFAPGGSPQFHFELVPYAWLPWVSGKVTVGNGAVPGALAVAAAPIVLNQDVPTASNLSSSLNAAFMGYGLVRYGRWSTEFDLNYVRGSQSATLGPGIVTSARSIAVGESLTNVAPGLGYEMFNGHLGSVPATFDWRAGFSWTKWNSSTNFALTGLDGTQHNFGISDHRTVVLPWVGVRGAIYPWPRWRFQAEIAGNGFGVTGVWGWNGNIGATWAATHLLNLSLSFRAISLSRSSSAGQAIQATTMTGYGPIFGVGFSF
jgi:hypothetical protein